jgi:hypothetical protein
MFLLPPFHEYRLERRADRTGRTGALIPFLISEASTPRLPEGVDQRVQENRDEWTLAA